MDTTVRGESGIDSDNEDVLLRMLVRVLMDAGGSNEDAAVEETVDPVAAAGI